LEGSDYMEKACFPMKTMNITQGVNGGYSHKDTFCIDNAGEDNGIDNVYAPFTGKIVQISVASNSVFFESLNPVKCADGDECFVTAKFTHDNDISNLYVGKIVNQGVQFYNEGTKGNATGNHCDISVAKGKNQGYTKNSLGNWVLKGAIEPWKVFFVNTNKTRIWNGYNYPWVLTDNSVCEPPKIDPVVEPPKAEEVPIIITPPEPQNMPVEEQTPKDEQPQASEPIIEEDKHVQDTEPIKEATKPNNKIINAVWKIICLKIRETMIKNLKNLRRKAK
jgi:hypothetical protein